MKPNKLVVRVLSLLFVYQTVLKSSGTNVATYLEYCKSAISLQLQVITCQMTDNILNYICMLYGNTEIFLQEYQHNVNFFRYAMRYKNVNAGHKNLVSER